MGHKVKDQKDELTGLERKVVYKRMKNIEDKENRGDITELINRL